MPWVIAFLAVLLTLWSVVTRYKGISHDAQLYTLQAVAKLNPAPLANDIFLRFASQDRFSVFSTFCAKIVALFGVDRAAASLTVLFLLSWMVVAWAIARKLQDTRLSLLSIALLAIVPGWYGAREVFRYAEPFMTARCAAEVLSLAALLAVLSSRSLLGAGLLAIAFMVHPLMSFPMAIAATGLLLVPPSWKAWSGITILVVAGAIAGSYLIGLPDPVMHGEWLEATRWRSLFLFTDQWLTPDWALAAQLVLTLAIAVLVLPDGQARQVSAASLCVSIAGLSLAIFSSEVLPIKLLLQGQPWRWIWIGRFVATALMPLIVVNLWRAGAPGRASAILLACAWLLGTYGSYAEIPPMGAGGFLILTALMLFVIRERLSAEAAAISLGLAWTVLAAVVVTMLSALMIVARSRFEFGYDPMWAQRIVDVLGTHGISVVIATTAWYLIVVRRSLLPTVLAVSLAAVLLAGTAPESFRRLSITPHDEQHRARLAHWRAIIPEESEVLWAGSPQNPWFLLDRQSYMTVSQGAGTVFSPETASELVRRAEVLAPLVAPGKWFLHPDASKEEFESLTPRILAQICADTALGFVVSKDRTTQAISSAEWPRRGDSIYLYDCRKVRRESET
jgi:hypothetical protein